MTGRDLSRLLRPRSVAILGGGWAENVVEACRAMGFAGEIWPVNPKRTEMAGVPCLPDLAALPAPPDAAFVAVNRTASVEAVAALSAMGAGGAVAFASGFSETADGAALEAALVAAAGDMPVLGPNCYGCLNYLDGAALWPDQHGGARVARGVAFVSQSSNVALSVTMQRRGLPLAQVVCVGNQAQTGVAEIVSTLAADPRITAIGLYLEGLRNPVGFAEAAAEARAAGKPVVAIRSGRSAAAQAAALSHTASIAGSDAAARAFFRRAGVPLARSLPELLDALHLLHVHGPLARPEIVAMSCSGGEAGLIADAAEARGAPLAVFDAVTSQAVAAALGPMIAPVNPLDYHTFVWGDAPAMTRAFCAAFGAEAGLGLLALDYPREDRCDAADWAPAVEALAAASAATGLPAAAVAALPENMPEARAVALSARGVAPLTSLETAVGAAAIAAEAAVRPTSPPLRMTAPADGPTALLDEAEAKRRLAGFGLAVPEGRLAETPEAAGAAARALGGAVAVKRLGLAHKTEAGGVALAPADPAAAARAMGAGPWLVERMVAGGVAELLIGVRRDPAWGLVLTVGAGGVLAELMEDTATLALPVAAEEVRAALGGLRIGRVLAGWRGRPAGDVEAAAAAALALSAFAEANAATLEEAEVNPLIVTADGAVAADALVRLRGPGVGGTEAAGHL